MTGMNRRQFLKGMAATAAVVVASGWNIKPVKAELNEDIVRDIKAWQDDMHKSNGLITYAGTDGPGNEYLWIMKVFPEPFKQVWINGTKLQDCVKLGYVKVYRNTLEFPDYIPDDFENALFLRITYNERIFDGVPSIWVE